MILNGQMLSRKTPTPTVLDKTSRSMSIWLNKALKRSDDMILNCKTLRGKTPTPTNIQDKPGSSMSLWLNKALKRKAFLTAARALRAVNKTGDKSSTPIVEVPKPVPFHYTFVYSREVERALAALNGPAAALDQPSQPSNRLMVQQGQQRDTSRPRIRPTIINLSQIQEEYIEVSQIVLQNKKFAAAMREKDKHSGSHTSSGRRKLLKRQSCADLFKRLHPNADDKSGQLSALDPPVLAKPNLVYSRTA